MKKIGLLFCSACIILAACNGSGADEKAKTDSVTTPKKDGTANTGTTAPMDTAAMNKAWHDFKTPGDMHKWLEKTNGTWEAELSQWMDPSAPAMKSKSTIVQSSIMGGRYVTSKFSGTVFGQPMQGQSTTGYDNARKLFVSTWIDDLGTGVVFMTGTYDSTTKTLNLKGLQTEPTTGKEVDIREEMTIIDNDSYTMTMYSTGMDGKEMKFLEGTYKRKK